MNRRKSADEKEIPFPSLLSTAAWNRVVTKRKLTSREAEVAALLCRGASGRTIEVDLAISAPTLKTHTRSIYRKFACRNKLELVLGLVHEEFEARRA